MVVVWHVRMYLSVLLIGVLVLLALTLPVYLQLRLNSYQIRL